MVCAKCTERPATIPIPGGTGEPRFCVGCALALGFVCGHAQYRRPGDPFRFGELCIREPNHRGYHEPSEAKA